MSMKDLSSPELVKKAEEWVELIKDGTIKNIHVEKEMNTDGKIYECPRCSYVDLTENMKPMKDKVIFESEEECNDYLLSIGLNPIFIPMAISDSKQNGYIRKDIVEEAEEMYKDYCDGKSERPYDVVIHTLYKAMKEQKSKLEKKK